MCGRMASEKYICPLGCGWEYDSEEELKKHMDYVKKFNIDDTKRDRRKFLLDGNIF
jgi:hypothetical protein